VATVDQLVTVTVFVSVVNAVELVVRPISQIPKALHSAMVFTCQLKLSDEELANNGEDVEFTIQWFDVDHNNQEITDTTGRLIPLPALVFWTHLCSGLIDC